MSSILAWEKPGVAAKAPGSTSLPAGTISILKERRLLHCHSILLVRQPHGFGEDWQSAWQRRHSRFRRAEIGAKTALDVDLWARIIVETAVSCYEPVVVVAEGFACLATIQASALQSQLIAGALLVSPDDPFARREQRLLNVVPQFPTVVVARRADGAHAKARSAALAASWGSEFLDVTGPDEAGNQNVEWEGGLDLLERLCRRVAALRVIDRGLAF